MSGDSDEEYEDDSSSEAEAAQDKKKKPKDNVSNNESRCLFVLYVFVVLELSMLQFQQGSAYCKQQL